MQKYFYHTKKYSNIAQTVFNARLDFDWHAGKTNDQFQVRNFNQSLIQHDKFLKQIHERAQGVLNFFKFPAGVVYNWHQDATNEFNINLIFAPQRSFSLFKAKPGDYQESNIHSSLIPVVEVDYTPYNWTVFNAQIPHMVGNLDSETRYLLTYNVKKTQGLTYQEFVAGLL
jgi:hypothetical protein